MYSSSRSFPADIRSGRKAALQAEALLEAGKEYIVRYI